VDYHRNSTDTVATRLFWSEHKSKFSAHWQLDSRSGYYRCHTRHIETAWGGVDPLVQR
jgi:hypothetical protein